MHVGDFATIVGALASAAALVAIVQQLVARQRRRRTVVQLQIAVGRLLRIRRRLLAWIASVTQDPRLATHSDGYLTFYVGTAHELEQLVSEIRSVDAEGATERLRSDVESAVRAVLRQWDWGATMIPQQRLMDGLRHPHGLHAIQRGEGVNLAAEERNLILLLRSIMRRLGNPHVAESLDEVLPLDPNARYDVDAMWGNDVRPLLGSWSGEPGDDALPRTDEADDVSDRTTIDSRSG